VAETADEIINTTEEVAKTPSNKPKKAIINVFNAMRKLHWIVTGLALEGVFGCGDHECVRNTK
jgi:hypothetical protein